MELILRKVLIHTLLPLGTSLILLLFFLISRKNRKWPVVSALSVLWLFSTGFISELLFRIVEHPYKIEKQHSLKKANAIIVLSGGGIHQYHGNSNVIEWGDPDRFNAGVKLFKEGKATKLYFTGGFNVKDSNSSNEGTLYIKKAIELGVPANSVFSTQTVTNTLQEANAISKNLKSRIDIPRPKIILVTSAFHMQRAKRIFERRGLEVQIFPVDFKTSSSSMLDIFKQTYNWIPIAGNLNKSSIAIKEIMGRIVYKTWK